MKTALIVAALLLPHMVLGQTSSSLVASPQFKSAIEEGLAAIKKNDFAAAEQSFRALSEAATNSNDRFAQSHAQFYLGYLTQMRGETATASGDKEKAFADALVHYERSVRLDPNSGGALHNMASIQLMQGDWQSAASSLRRAVDLPDPRKAMFAEELGDLYAAHKDAASAVAYYRIAIDGNESSARGKLLEVLGNNASPEATAESVSLLVKTYHGGDVDAALAGALHLIEGAPLTERDSQRMFSLVAVSLSKKNYDYVALAQAGVTAHLVKIGDRADCPACVSASTTIRRLYAGESPDLSWWHQGEQKDDVTPANAMRALLRTLGNGAVAAHNFAHAELLLNSAVGLAPWPDLDSVTLLASVYYAQGRFPDLQALANRFTKAISTDNSGAAAGADWEAAFAFHRAFGAMYAWLKHWNDPDPYAGATFHLERAVEALPKANAARRAAGQKEILPDPTLYDLLAQAYAVAGREQDSARALIQSAEAYILAGDATSARKTLATTRFVQVPEDFVARYSRVLGTGVTIALPSGEVQDVSDVDTLRGMLAVKARIITPEISAADGPRADAVLRSLGVTSVNFTKPGTGMVATRGGQLVAFQVTDPHLIGGSASPK